MDDLEALWEEEANEDGEDLAETEKADGDEMSQDPPQFDDDSNAISLDKIKNQSFDERKSNVKVIPPISDDEDDAAPSGNTQTPSVMQSAFQPGSTPTHFPQRYLCWNSIGIVKGLIDEAKGISSIVVDFHDITLHHTIQIPNQNDYTLADLSEKALIIASQGKDREEGEEERSLIKATDTKTFKSKLNWRKA